jgi:hypothetical protein
MVPSHLVQTMHSYSPPSFLSDPKLQLELVRLQPQPLAYTGKLSWLPDLGLPPGNCDLGLEWPLLNPVPILRGTREGQ